MHLLCNADAYHGDSHSRKIFPNTNSPSCVTQAGFSSLMVSWYVASTTNTDIHVSDQLFTSHFTFYFFFEPPPYLLVKFIEHRTRFLILPKLTEFLCRQPPLWKSCFYARFAFNWRLSVSSFEVRLKPSGFDRIVFNQIDWIHIQCDCLCCCTCTCTSVKYHTKKKKRDVRLHLIWYLTLL